MTETRRLLLTTLRVVVLSLTVSTPAYLSARAENSCAGFAWSLDDERKAFAAPAATWPSGYAAQSLPDGALRLDLKPAAEAEPAVATLRKNNSQTDTYIGWFTIPIESPGIYQVTISQEGWIDVGQDGSGLSAIAHTGKKDCETIRKSVRFQVTSGKATVQISGAQSPAIVVQIRKVD